MDAQWMIENDDSSIQMSIVYAHNFMEIVRLNGSGSVDVLYSVQCQVRCILYSARIFGTTRDTLTIASGTVFNEVHIWKPLIKDECDDAVVYKKLIGHEGVIFCVRFNHDASQIASVSDDRTIRIWSLEDERYTPHEKKKKSIKTVIQHFTVNNLSYCSATPLVYGIVNLSAST